MAQNTVLSGDTYALQICAAKFVLLRQKFAVVSAVAVNFCGLKQLAINIYNRLFYINGTH